MAQLNLFKCDKCGYTCQAKNTGYDRFMFGWFGYYSCKKCKNVVTLQIPEIAKDEEGFDALYRVLGKIENCPKCGERKCVPWATKCLCPRCGEKMISTGLDIMAD